MSNAEIEEAFRRFKAASPEPKTELKYVNPFTLLVAVVLSAQATDAGVNKATPALFALADTPEKMAALGEAKVRDLIKTIGLFRTKAKNVVGAVRRFWPSSTAGRCRTRARRWRRCPASAARPPTSCSTSAFGEPTIAVDTHIFRVGNRTGLAHRQEPARGRAEAGSGRAGEI